MRHVVLTLMLVASTDGCVTEADRQRHENDKRLDRYYEEEWIKCVNDLDIERCKVIQETGMRQCLGYRHGQNVGLEPCAQERFEDRLVAVDKAERKKKKKKDEDEPTDESGKVEEPGKMEELPAEQIDERF